MQTKQILTQDSDVQTSLSILQKVFSNYHPRNFAVRFWDGTTWEPEPDQQALFTIVLQHPGALRQMFSPVNELTLGESYIYNDFDIEGDIEAAFKMAEHLLSMRLSIGDKVRIGGQLLKLPSDKKPHIGRQAAQLKGSLHSKERDRQAVTYHYNVSNEFFALWLDQWMVYSCAYFFSPDEDLDVAQERKLDYICRKLRLHRSERLLDIGCGWGGLVIYAAKKYGITALGITLSEPQAQLANERIRREGLSEQCRVEIRDYREIDEPEGYDKLVSVGMFEHVGESKLPEYFERAWRLLRQGGVFLNHGIASGFNQPKINNASFSERYIFPDSQLLPISTSLRVAESSGFKVRDVENLREHYMLTLRNWRRRLEAHHEEASRLTDEPTYRIWRLSQAGSAYGFQTGRHNIYQALFVKPVQGESKLPLTRADWYV
ncbi:MAG: cyclopropane-fatty-acyl-phospholipid synthase family protein [Bacteroidota bacterium]|nr:cyclopropane-fatty-acyl-phospholipid synthase family protein [Bacteroidota bacterium]